MGALRTRRPILTVVVAIAISTAVATAASTAGGAPALLVLRVACSARDHSIFSSSRLERYARARYPVLRGPLRLLDRQSTCEAGWQSKLTNETLLTLASGGVAACAGWPGAAACDAITAAGRLLRKPQPAACVTQGARAAAVVRLAATLGWRRALVPAAEPSSECEAALTEVARALLNAQLLVYRTLVDDDLSRRPQVLIMCASRPLVVVNLLKASVSLADDRPATLLLYVEELNAAPLSETTQFNTEDFKMSNITLDVGNTFQLFLSSNLSSRKRYAKFRTPNNSSMEHYNQNLKNNSVLMNTDRNVGYRSRRSLSSSSNTIISYKGLDEWGTKELNLKKTPSAFSDEKTLKSSKTIIHSNVKNFFQRNRSRLSRSSNTMKAENPNPFLRQIDETIPLRLLLLSHSHLGTSPDDEIVTYDSILQEVVRANEAELTRRQVEKHKFWLFERSEDGLNSPWSQIAVMTSMSKRLLDDAGEWTTIVNLENASQSLESWSDTHVISKSEEAFLDAWSLVLVIGVAAASASAVGAAARFAAKRRGRRTKRADAVLAPADFLFPADEQRRVGEGMETMLSCWLQQLHEFGGPEMERPDLLKQPPPRGRAPSAPSSTCSVNRVPHDRRTRYKGDAVHMKYLAVNGTLELKRKTTDVLLLMQSLRHENLNPFIGCLCEVRPALVFDHCGRGSLEDVLMADDIKLDWTFRLSLLTDLVKGMRYLHASTLRVHGRLSSRNCVVDSRWVLRITDFATQSFYRAQGLLEPEKTARDLLWTAPELLRESRGGAGGTQPGDVFSFAIVMQEVIVRGEPYCMLALTPEEIVEKVSRPPPLIRPSVSMGAAPPEAVSVMRQCWAEAPEHRPDFHRLHDIFRHLHRGRKINIVDSMFEMLEKYSNNLEELIRERTEQLDMEKKKTEQLLNRMLPRSVAERLMLGSRVEPEEFEEVSIYFSDIVGFTALAARSTPVQVVDLLNDLYTTFDAAIEQYRVYKVETIGDAYMVVGGLPVRARDHAESVATMALHLLHLAGCFRVRHLPDTPLRLRIGLHSGPCCAAVVGLTMPRYCLFGDTVNTASRMESTGATWRIQISAATADKLVAAGGYRLRSRGLTQIKGKGAMHTYWLLGKEGFDKPLPTPPPLESEEILFETDGENDSEASSAPSSTPKKNSSIDHLEVKSNCANYESEMALSRLSVGAPGVEGRVAWRRSGAASADSSPPRLAHSYSQSQAHSRYRCLAGGPRALRRQWSLERGEALAEAVAVAGAGAVAPLERTACEPLALLAGCGSRATTPRYRLRRDAAAEDAPRFFP